MYKIAKQYPDLIDYIEDADTYLLRCYHIMDALYNEGTVGYNWATGLMGESTTPDIIEALQERGYEEEAANLTSIMEKKFQNFANDPYPYISEYPYDNTSEEAIYTLAKMFGNDSVMSKEHITIHEIINAADLLISDYSSIYVEYFLNFVEFFRDCER